MANEKVVFKRGTTTNLPTTKTPGTVLLDITTGAMYVDDTSSSRIQVKDTTKLGKTETASAAEKLSNTKAIGSATNPVYFNSSGVPVACTYTLGKSVPSSAVFTDTKVTAVGNHYTPSGGTTTSASGGTLTDITNSTSGIQVVTGVTKDAAGHVTGVTSVALKSVNTNTDTKVTQTNTTTSADYRIILSANSNDTTETSSTRKSANFLANPSTGEFYAKGYRRTDLSGKTVDINTYNLSSGSPMRMFFIEKTNAGADNITNIPVASVPFLLDVELIRWVSATDYVTRQIYTNAANPANSYVRYCTNGTWGEWTKRVYTDTTYSLSEAASGGTYKITLTTSTGSEVKTATVPAGTTSAYGLVKLSSATNSTSTALAATPSAVKSAYDLANSANTLAGSKSTVSFSRSLTSGTKVGTITIDGTATDIYCQTNTDTKVTISTTNPTSSTNYYPTFAAGAGTGGVSVNNGLRYASLQGSADTVGYGRLILGNSTASGTDGNKYGRIDIYSESSSYGSIEQANVTSAVTHTLPATSGTILNTGTTSFTASLTSGTKIGTIKINGTSTDIYCQTNTDIKNTAGSTNTSSKIFLIGATSQAANPQTYSHDTAYVGTDGCLYSNNTKVSVEGHTHSYLPLDGGIMTGPIKYNSGSKVSTPIVITDGDENGSMMAIGGTGGLTILGAGESANALGNLIATENGFPIPASDSGKFSYTAEHLILSADTHIYFFTNCNTVADRKAMVLTSGLNLYPDTTNTGNIGTSTYKWAGMYATTFHGALDGNASTATSAGKWTTGRTLTIGSTGKSVDGSGNVSWTLAEIGAAAASHTHTKSQITDFPTSLKNPSSLTVQGNGTTSFTYDGSAAKTLNIKPGTGISVSSDTSGNITITNTSTNTDTKVTQNNSTADSSLRVLLSKSANDTNETNVSYKSNKITFNPSTGLLDIKGKVSISDSSYGCLELYRSGSNYFAGIKFYNDTSDSSGTKQLLGSLGMGGEPNSGLWRYNTDGSTKYKILDTENTSFTRSLTSGTKIGTIKINGTSTDIYCETNTDTKVTQTNTTTSANYRIILSGNSNDTTETTTVRKSTNFFANPSTGEMFSNIFTSQSSTRHTSLYTSGIKCVTDSSTGSAMGMKYYTADGATLIGEFGMYASTNATKVDYAYIGKSYEDKWLNITEDNTDFSGSIYVPHRIINKGKSCSTSAGSGAAGYYCIAQIKITNTYLDAPIEIEVCDRGKVCFTTFSIRFANENSTDPSVSSLTYRGFGLTAYICKSATSTWQLWVQANGTYSAIAIHSIKCSYMSKMTISYPETYLSNSNFETAIASGGSLATNTKAIVGTTYRVGAASQWVTSRNINGMSINGSADIVNYGTCSTTNTTVEKVVACTGFDLKTGSEITVKFTVTNKAKNPTLNVNSTGAKPIYYRGAAISASYLAANRTYTFRYNGSQYDLVGDVNTNTDVNVAQTNLAVTTTDNQGLKLPLLLASKTVNSNNSYTDSNAYAVNCANKTSGASMTGLAWLETSYYSTSGTSGRPYAKICCEAFKCVGSGNFEGNATSASRLQTARKINGVDFTGQIDISLTKLLYSGSGSSTVTISADATNFDVLVIVVHMANATDKTFIHATSSPIVQHPYCTYPTQGSKTTATLGNIATNINGTTVGVSVSNILISGSGSTVSCASETRAATINAVYGFNFS